MSDSSVSDQENMSVEGSIIQEDEEIESNSNFEIQASLEQEECEEIPFNDDEDDEENFWDDILSAMPKSPAILIQIIDGMKLKSKLWQNEKCEMEKAYAQIVMEEAKVNQKQSIIKDQTLVVLE